jgi:hypothetical protein
LRGAIGKQIDSMEEVEFGQLDLGDARLNRRARILMERLAAEPTASVPKACNGWGETMAAYRFFDNGGVDWRAILEPHWQQTQARMGTEPVVLCLQGTTELDFNGQQARGLGPLSYEAQRGMYLHPTYAVTPERVPLGILDAWMWTREKKDASGRRGGPKESLRWIEGYERLAEVAPHLPETRLVYVADREADMLPLMLRAQELGTPVDWLVRAAPRSCGRTPVLACRWARSSLPCRHGTASRRAPCVSNSGRSGSSCPSARAASSSRPVSSRVKSMRRPVSNPSNGAC